MLRGAIFAAAFVLIFGCTSTFQLTPAPRPSSSIPASAAPGSAVASASASTPAASASPSASPGSATPPRDGSDGAGSIVYIVDSNLWLAAPDGSSARQLTTDGSDAQAYHDPSKADEGTIYVLKGASALYRLDRSGVALTPPVSLITLENGAEGLAAAPDGTRVAYATVGSGTYVDPRFGTPTGTFLYGGTDVANLDGTSVPGGVLPSLIYPSWVDGNHLVATDGVDLYFDEVGPAQQVTWLSLDDGCVTDFDCPPGDEASATLSTPAVSPDGRALAYTYRPFFGPAGRRMARLGGPPPAVPETQCVMAGQEHHSDTGTFSGDGALFVYDDTRFDPDAFETVIGDGIWTLAVDLAAEDCGASTARLVAHGGSQPDWGPAAP
jgi:hypothetical protein